MDSTRGASGSVTGGVGKQPGQSDSPEQLLDVFKAAALSVTKLYKISALAQSKAKADGYQECLDDLLALLDRENLGLNDGEGWRVRQWATERLDGRDRSQSLESEDEIDKAETSSSPELTRVNSTSHPSSTRTGSVPPNVPSIVEEPTHIVVPSQDTFTFQSTHQYPNIATLDLSDSRPHDTSRPAKSRFPGGGGKSGARSGAHLGRGAGSKRRMDFDDFFGGCLGGKDPFGNGNKRSRHS